MRAPLALVRIGHPQDWSISLDELLRAIQFYNTPEGYQACEGGEDGFCLGAAVRRQLHAKSSNQNVSGHDLNEGH